MQHVLCLGSLNAHPEDRYMNREDLRGIQLFENGTPRQLPNLSLYGKLGPSSMAIAGGKLFISSGDDLSVASPDGALRNCHIPNLLDVHELTAISGLLWIASTGTNELVCVDPTDKRIVKRISLSAHRNHFLPAATEITDNFHCNQAFKDHEKKLCAIVHHVNGKQHLARTFRSRIEIRLKQQGNGGVLNAETGEIKLRGLKGPHSCRVLEDGTYVILDSGRFELQQYDRRWRLLRKTSTTGWGRGLAYSDKHFYIGVSETRKRYLHLVPTGDNVPNMILVLRRDDLRVEARWQVHGVEQINNLYLVSDEIATMLGILQWKPST